MNKRIPLPPDTLLSFTNYEGGTVSYIITNELAAGGACMVYNGCYINNSGNKIPVRIKECYPFKLHISRTDTGELLPPQNEIKYFEEYKRRMRNSFDISSELLKTSSLTNSISNILDIYELNNTVYIVSSYAEGFDLTKYQIKTLKDAVKIVQSAAKSIEKIHNKGYLYLDLKPENVFVFGETCELIQLFDFDSMIPINAENNILEYQISYSDGFAPIEQKMGVLSELGKYSDVYSVGALLFYLLFGKAPTAFDCGEEAIYDFTQMKWEDCYRDKLYTELTKFFHCALESYYIHRYQSMDLAVRQLEMIAEYADMSKPFIRSSAIPNDELVIGREKEIASLIKWSKNSSPCIFISGMGGIGKSTVVRKFLNKVWDNFENIVYLYFNETLCDTLIDDIHFSINNCEKSLEETNSEYYKRKIKTAGRLGDNTNSILIIDNYSGALDNDFEDILNIGWKVIAVTRKNMENTGYDMLSVWRLSNIEDLHRLFFSKIGYELGREKLYALDCIIKMVAGHTLALELIAGQIANSYLSIEQAFELTEKYGFSNMAGEKVDFVKDGRKHYKKIEQIIRAVYDIGTISAQKRKIMKITSLFDAPGIQIRELKRLLDLKSFDAVNELRDTGWINIAEEYAVLHPLIQETIQQVEWNEEYRRTAVQKMKELLAIIKFNGKDSKKSETNEKTLSYTLKMSKSVLKYCGRDNLLAMTKVYNDLMFAAVMNMPKDQEEYILSQAKKMLYNKGRKNIYEIIELYDYVVYLYCQQEDFKAAEKTLNFAYQYAKKQADNYIWGLYYDMLEDFYDTLLAGSYSYQETSEDGLFAGLMNANEKAISYMKKSNHENAKRLLAKNMIGRSMLLIRSVPEQTQKIKKLILRTKRLIKDYIPDEKSISDKKHTSDKKYIFDRKHNFQINISDKKYEWNRKNISDKNSKRNEKSISGKKCEQNEKELFSRKRRREYLEVCSVYYMAWAWYYTLCEPDKKLVQHNLERSNQINQTYEISELDTIDSYIIPAANMMCELDEPALALDWLEQGIKICEENAVLIPYIRKKLDLLSYQLEVSYGMKDAQRGRNIIRLIDEENERNRSIGVYGEVPEVVREELFTGFNK